MTAARYGTCGGGLSILVDHQLLVHFMEKSVTIGS
ncbi:hypothetical protein SAMN04489857_1552 [Parafannyhessea umbonata]|uniref:Uncharacterized protein n=1 Tax=Parafannyhessea umbonata TaxID=604330 RepID=A0A1H1MUM6_9ACTN|nr:hypothetical protein SAMN04489857_1552 [Parafannyhessea umbonata]